MAINDVLALTVDVSATTDKFVKALQQAAQGANLDINVADTLIKSFKAAQTNIKGLFAQTVAAGAEAGLGKAQLSGFISKLQPLTDNIESSMKKIFEMEVKIRQGGLDAAAQQQLQSVLGMERIQLNGLESRLKIERAGAAQIIKRRKDAVQEAERLAARTMAEAGEEFGQSVGAAFEDIKSGKIGNLLKGMGKRSGAMGVGLQEKGAARKAEGKMGGGMMESLGGFLSKLGPALGAIGAIASGFAAIAAVIIMADSAVKEMNRNLMASGIAGADLSDKFGRVGDTMKRVSQGFMESFTFNRIWGTTAKDHLEILGAYAEAGVTFKQMAEGVKDAGKEMENLKKYTVASLTYSKLLGLSTKEISEAMGAYMTDLGFTLEGVEAKFSNITRAAQESGFATKRFFNMVLQATTGMSMYNVRLEEAAGLLMQLGKMLGQKMGGEMLQNLVKGFKDESTLDRTKKTKTTGVQLTIDTLRQDSLRASEDFLDKMEHLGKDKGEDADKFNQILEKFGVKEAGKALDSKKLVHQLATMKDPDRQAMESQAMAVNPAMGRQLAALSRKSVVNKKGAGLGEAQYARGEAGPGATLWLQLNEMKEVIGKRADEIKRGDITTQAAYEQSGRSGETFRTLAAVGDQFAGQQQTIAEAQKKIKGAKNPGEAIEFTREFNDAFGKQFGIILDEQGKRHLAKTGLQGGIDINASKETAAIGDSLQDLVTNVGGGLKGDEGEKVSEDIALAQEIAENTTDIAKVMEAGVEALLSKIFSSVQYIASWFGMGSDKKAAQAKATASADLEAKSDAARKQLVGNQKNLARLRRGMHSKGKSQEDKDKDKEAMEVSQEAIKRLSAQLEVLNAQGKAVGRVTSEEAANYQGGAQAPASYVASASQTEGVRGAVQHSMKVLTGGGDIAGAAAEAGDARKQAVQRRLQELWKILNPTTVGGKVTNIAKSFSMSGQSEIDKLQMEYQALQAEDSTKGGTGAAEGGVWSRAMQALGVDSGVAGQFNGEGTVVPGKDLKEFLGEGYLDLAKVEKQNAIELSTTELTKEAEQKRVLAASIVAGIAKIQADAADKQLATEMANLGVEGDPEHLLKMATSWRATGVVPDNVHLDKKVLDPKTGQERREGEILGGSTAATPIMASSIYKDSGAAGQVPAKDMIMHIDESGKVVAQRVSKGDQMTVAATMPGGGFDQAASAARRGGSGGVTIINHNYNDGEGIRKSWRNLQAARALG